jgi:tetratricopeptide (TPR) repeat protein
LTANFFSLCRSLENNHISQIPDGIFQDCTEYRPKILGKRLPQYYQPTAAGLFRNGLKMYMEKKFSSSLDFFQQLSNMDPHFSPSILGQAFCLFMLRRFEDSAEILSQSRAVNSPKECFKMIQDLTTVESQPIRLRYFFHYSHYLYECGAFKEALRLLNMSVKISRKHLLSLDLKSKCFLMLDDFHSAWKCKIQLKAHANEETFKEQRLSKEEKKMLLETIQRLSICDEL